ncbi:hypothetical protein Esti_000359 [Eimeria stiedai]
MHSQSRAYQEQTSWEISSFPHLGLNADKMLFFAAVGENMAEAKGYVGLKLQEVLDRLGAHSDLKCALPGIFKECCAISKALRTARVTSAGSSNTFGEEQLTVDLLAEDKLREWAKGCGAVRAVSSEEATDLVEVNPAGSLIVCWDPLDGSSIVDCNWSVASIFGIWQTGQNRLEWKGANTLIDATGRQQVASILVIYGPRTTALLCVEGLTFDFQLDSDGSDYVVVRGPCSIRKEGAKIFSPANLRAAQDLSAYNDLVQEWMKKRYTLRYTGKCFLCTSRTLLQLEHADEAKSANTHLSTFFFHRVPPCAGGLGPDVYQLFVKGHGIFCNPASTGAPAKLRVLYEVAPIALLVEAAGGCSSSGNSSALDVVIKTMDQRTAFCCGSEEEVRKIEKALRC